MRKIYLVLVTILLCGSGLFAQTPQDQAQILQLCVDLPELQKNYPVGIEGDTAAVYIMQYPIVIPTDIAISKFGKKPVFMTRHEIYDNNVEAFFLFKNLDILESSARVDLSMYYDYNSAEQKVFHIALDFQKENEEWVVGSYEIERK
ncbi:hypothetical protein [uncultured Sunxiuqinia sp.]|uniref:hypothetical protein n=1 Tax=uncultured Sunxiuqinia sp. TaxID=1573825 RepID=UPI002AA7CAF7|nr:hypothetical protein [uncultured Sunxiuqinia sp.]